jgi:hypothetical protein
VVVTGNNWQTPEWFLDLVRQLGDIALDPATNSTNPTRATKFITAEHDPCGLLADWSDDGVIYCNPPYGRGHMDPWAGKIIYEAERGREIIALTRGDLSTRWARRMVLAARLCCFPPRLRFRNATGTPPFPNVVFYYGPRPQTFTRVFQDLGPVVAPITNPTNHRI